MDIMDINEASFALQDEVVNNHCFGSSITGSGFSGLKTDVLSVSSGSFKSQVDQLKAEFIAEAKAGMPKPNIKVDESRYVKFSSYMRTDKDFRKTILSINPDWDIATKDANKLKAKFIAEAKAGMPKPISKDDYPRYMNFCRYMKTDAVFRETILSINPDWELRG